MKGFFNSGKFKIFAVIGAVILGLIIGAVYNEGSANVVSSVVSAVTTPLQRLSTSVSSAAKEKFQKYANAQAIYEENLTLKEENIALNQKLADYNTMKNENQQYEKMLGLIKEDSDWTLQPSVVIARDPQSRFYSFTIDKGAYHGVSYLDPVISAEGLVGYVVEVGQVSSKVITILDVKASVGIYDSENRDIGVLTGSVELAEEGLCAMDYLDYESKVTKGDRVLTSGSLVKGMSLFPRDIYVGEIVEVVPHEDGTTLRGIIRPAANVDQVKDVFVITDFAGKGQE